MLQLSKAHFLLNVISLLMAGLSIRFQKRQ